VGRTTGARLASAPMEIIGRFTDASNATLLGRLLDRGPEPLEALRDRLGRDPGIGDLDAADLVVYKPRDGERPLWDYPDGTLHRREVAAALVDRGLGAELVPETVLRDDGPHGPGSVQEFVPHDPQQHYFTIRDPALSGQDPRLRGRLLVLAVFDLVIDNADRKGGHLLVADGDGPVADRLRAVDHGVSFNTEDKHRTVVWDLASSPLGTEVTEALDRLVRALGGELGARLEALLTSEEVAATVARARALRSAGVLPEPHGPRPFPWPLL